MLRDLPVPLEPRPEGAGQSTESAKQGVWPAPSGRGSREMDPVPCPRCSKGHIVERTSADDRHFYACNQWPRCKFTSSYRLVAGKCPECSSPYLVERQMKSRQWVECPNKDCGWRPPRPSL